jgi:hypothetical protein
MQRPAPLDPLVLSSMWGGAVKKYRCTPFLTSSPLLSFLSVGERRLHCDVSRRAGSTQSLSRYTSLFLFLLPSPEDIIGEPSGQPLSVLFFPSIMSCNVEMVLLMCFGRSGKGRPQPSLASQEGSHYCAFSPKTM